MATEPEDPHARTAERNRKLLTQREAIIAQFADDPAVREWLTQFRDDGKGFLDDYADKLAKILLDGARAYDYQQRKANTIEAEAIERLWEIQQRKLLLLQCRWRANEIKLPADFVELTDDFESWGQRIHECPYLDPITPAEVDDYLNYLLSDECRDAAPTHPRPTNWQDFESYRQWLQLQAAGYNPARIRDGAFTGPPVGMAALVDAFDEFSLNYPRYYRWCDERDGPPNLLLLLPDTRGEQETYFMCYGRDGRDPHADDEATESETAETEERASPPAAVPFRTAYQIRHEAEAQLEALLRLEAPELLPYHRAYQQQLLPLADAPLADDQQAEDDDDDEDDDSADYDDLEGDETADRWLHDSEAAYTVINKLMALTEYVPIRAAADWREGLLRAWTDWYKRQLAARIRTEFAAYQARERAGEPHPPVFEDEEVAADTFDDRQLSRNWILKGRELAGFPRDLNF